MTPRDKEIMASIEYLRATISDFSEAVKALKGQCDEMERVLNEGESQV